MTIVLQPLSPWARLIRRILMNAGLALTLVSAATGAETGRDFLVHNWDYDEGLPEHLCQRGRPHP